MRVLVLGATGFIGGQIARAAIQAGMEVRGFRRRPGSVGAIGDLPVTWHDGDLVYGRGLDEALADCDVLFYAAAYAPGSAYSVCEAKRMGVAQMRIVLNAARRANIKRVVYTSSLTTIGVPPAGSDRLPDERDGYLPGSTSNAYFEAKWVMEFEALRANQAGLPVISLCPTAVFGPGDVKPSTSQILLMVAKKQLPVGVDVEANIVDGRDVALAHVRAVTEGTPGERYIIGGHNMNVANALREAARLLGVREPRGALSLKTVTRLLRVAEFFRLPIQSTMRGMPYWSALNSEKGFETFGYTPRPFEETVTDTVGWFRENGYL